MVVSYDFKMFESRIDILPVISIWPWDEDGFDFSISWLKFVFMLRVEKEVSK